MKTTTYPRALALTLMLAGIGLSGCGGAMSFPDAVPSQQVQGPAIRGSVYGGHAPIVGSHVYVLQPGTSGYGSQAISLLGAGGQTSASGYAITLNSSQQTPDPNVPGTAEFVTTDANGAFNLTGGYSCTVGQPVFLYSYGGATPVTQGATTSKDIYGNGTYNVTQIVVSNVSATKNANTTATYTFTLSTAAAFTVGETVTVAAPVGYSFDGSQKVVTAPSTTTFSFVGSDPNGENANGTYNTTALGITAAGYGITSTPSATNPIVQMSTLGLCPSSGNFSTPGNGALSYVYMNEVSTVATAYTFQPFTLASNNSAWDIGTSGTTQALLGIQNAAQTAAQLYSIQGYSNPSTTNDGEGHLANTQTQASGVPNQGNGVVPQATIDQLADILAACIDSAPGNGGVLSTQCSTLFNTATDNGNTVASGDTPATDTATAAINIARYPAGNYSGTPDPNYVTDIFNVASGTVPYAPNLTAAPHDWTIAIQYPENGVTGYTGVVNVYQGSPESLQIDSTGEIWITSQGGAGGANIVRWDNFGVQNIHKTFGYIPGYVSVDGNGNAWTGNANSTSPIYEAGANGIFNASYGSGYNKAYVVITDKGGDVFTFASTANTGGDYEMFEYPAGSTTSTTATQVSISPSIITAPDNIGHGAIDASGDLWITSETSKQIARITPAGVSEFTPIVTATQPEFPAIDHAGNAWIAVQETASQIYVVSPTGAPSILTSGTTGAELTSTFGAAIDGNGNAWFVNRCGNYGQCGNTAGENSLIEISGATPNHAISPPTNYVPEAQYVSGTYTPMLNGSLNLAIDSSGNIWITNYTGNAVTEVIGAAAPVVTPLSVAAGNNMLGQKP